MKNNGKIVLLLSILLLLGVMAMSIYRWNDFSSNCSDYLKLAGDAPTVERADVFLGKAIEYLDREGLTSGNSAYIFMSRPKNDIGIWYGQISGVKKTTSDLIQKLKNNPASVTQYERDITLMKVREVVLDQSSKGVTVTVPSHISWFPYQWAMLIWWIASVFSTVVGVIAYGSENDWFDF